MSRSAVELDFFAMAENKKKNPSSIRGIQGAISRIDPTLLRRVIGGRATAPTPIPILNSINYRKSPESSSEKKPLTIFYNGSVVVLNVNQDTAERIIRLAEHESGSDRVGLFRSPHGDLPMARKLSLQRFLERRKERLIATAPYSSVKDQVGAMNQKAAMGFGQVLTALN